MVQHGITHLLSGNQAQVAHGQPLEIGKISPTGLESRASGLLKLGIQQELFFEINQMKSVEIMMTSIEILTVYIFLFGPRLSV